MVVIGAGWIGSEVAASARQLGTEVALIEAATVPLERVLGAEVGRHLPRPPRGAMAWNSTWAWASILPRFDRAEEVVLADGTAVAGDLVVVGVGVSPRTELAEAAGLPLDNGVVVDQHLATDTPGICAAGDVANVYHPVFDAASASSTGPRRSTRDPVAAKNMLGSNVDYTRCRNSSPTSTTSAWSTRLRRASGTRSSSGRSAPAGVHRLLARRRRPRGRDEHQRLGRRPSPSPTWWVPATGRSRPPGRPRRRPGRPHRLTRERAGDRKRGPAGQRAVMDRAGQAHPTRYPSDGLPRQRAPAAELGISSGFGTATPGGAARDHPRPATAPGSLPR